MGFNYPASNHFLLIEIPEISFKESFYPIFLPHILTAALDDTGCIGQHTTSLGSTDCLRSRHQVSNQSESLNLWEELP